MNLNYLLNHFFCVSLHVNKNIAACCWDLGVGHVALLLLKKQHILHIKERDKRVKDKDALWEVFRMPLFPQSRIEAEIDVESAGGPVSNLIRISI